MFEEISFNKPLIKRFDEIKRLIAQGHIFLHMTRAQLREILGKPDAISFATRKYKIPPVWKYGDVQFVFPPMKHESQVELDHLLYVYVDDDVLPEPFYLLDGISLPQDEPGSHSQK